MSEPPSNSSKSFKALRSKPQDDIYSLHGKYILEQYLAPKLQGVEWRLPFPQHTPTETTSTQESVRAQEITAPIGILGAGVGGLYAAMMLESIDIKFQILEASDTTGGRVFTHRFPNGGEHDYYDVGAMRFPDEPAMRRLFYLFESKQLNSQGLDILSKLIPYHFDSTDNNSFLEFNRIRKRSSEVKTEDVFDFGATRVPRRDLEKGYKNILDDVFDEFVQELRRDLKEGGRKGWDKMMEQDYHSARSYMAITKEISMPTIRWCETMDTSTDSYDKAFSEACLDIVAFGDEKTAWWCLDGGSQVLPSAMESYINRKRPGALEKPKFVTGLRTVGNDPKSIVGMNVYIDGETSPRQYLHVISTIPLPVFRTLDLDDKNLFKIEETNALRQLSYGPSAKIGIRFKTQWWKHAKNRSGQVLNITGGQSYTDRVIRRVVYPSYGLEATSETTVLIASYTWTSDAASLGALTEPGDPATLERLKNLVLRDLAELHDFDLSELEKEYVEMHPWTWQNDPRTQGAFAFFGPGQFGNLYTSLTKPCGGGRLHMAGEALSPRHAWIVGALDASWRAVYEIVVKDYPDKKKEFEEKWGKNEEWKPSPEFQKDIGVPAGAENEPLDLLMVHMMVNDDSL
ncbi:hypothetical protein FRC01_006711 [Tulasnella sp. 417]|nr:hypothetical protein FRC01_006711 [Tulasnella sp. 417]